MGPEAARAICATAVQHEIDMQSLKGSSSSSSSAASSCTNTITSSSTMNHRDQSQSSSVLIEQQQPTEEAHFPPNISNMSNRHYRAAFDHCIVPMVRIHIYMESCIDLIQPDWMLITMFSVVLAPVFSFRLYATWAVLFWTATNSFTRSQRQPPRSNSSPCRSFI